MTTNGNATELPEQTEDRIIERARAIMASAGGGKKHCVCTGFPCDIVRRLAYELAWEQEGNKETQ